MNLLGIGKAVNHLSIIMKNTKSKPHAKTVARKKIVERIVYVDRPAKPLVVELTSKKYKGIILLGNVLFIFAVFLFFLSLSGSIDPLAGIGFALMIGGIGLVIGIFGRFLAWWNNG